ncbi:MAG: SHOCT domain-containing protein [Chloroflexi bacterium]|nr:MAG: SHOCT domain-containing protein [Chloroflexota bacterium]TMG19769.1 MAG: SHOCT domain-containing protein [Chloroflexota bacterium]
MPDRYERLRQIGELRSSGVLSEAEFEQEKARILREP